MVLAQSVKQRVFSGHMYGNSAHIFPAGKGDFTAAIWTVKFLHRNGSFHAQHGLTFAKAKAFIIERLDPMESLSIQ